MSLGANLSVSLIELGEEKTPLFVVDDFLAEAPKLQRLSSQGAGFKEDKTDFYPGVRKPLNDEYANLVCRFARHLFTEYLTDFDVPEVATTLCAFSVTTSEPEKLLPIQRIPHFDTVSDQQWAVVHYLCDEDKGGTGFFRHRQTGFERITKDRSKRYQRVLDDQAITEGLPPAIYLQGETKLFELTHQVSAKFNRALFYPSNVLHSGLIKQWRPEDLSDARLTANTFIQIK